jgi:hypothetical protein
VKGGRIVFERLETHAGENSEESDSIAKSDESDEKSEKELKISRERLENENKLAQVTLAADRVAIFYLGLSFLPLVVGFSLYTLIMNKHLSWYSWVLTTLTTCVYAGGFVLMCPQLFINHKLKSVAHLPWKLLCFRFVNTFIDGTLPTVNNIVLELQR